MLPDCILPQGTNNAYAQLWLKKTSMCTVMNIKDAAVVVSVILMYA